MRLLLTISVQQIISYLLTLPISTARVPASRYGWGLQMAVNHGTYDLPAPFLSAPSAAAGRPIAGVCFQLKLDLLYQYHDFPTMSRERNMLLNKFPKNFYLAVTKCPAATLYIIRGARKMPTTAQCRNIRQPRIT